MLFQVLHTEHVTIVSRDGRRPKLTLGRSWGKQAKAMEEGTYVIVGVQHARNVLCQVSVQHRLDVATDVNWGRKEKKNEKAVDNRNESRR